MGDLYGVPSQLVKSIKGQLKDKKNQQLKRFEHVIDFDSDHFDPRFIMSTAVDPYTSFILSESADQLFPFIRSLVSSKLRRFDYFLMF